MKLHPLSIVRLSVLAIFSGISLAAAPMELAFPTNEDLRHTRSIDNPRVSPDATQVLFRLKESTADGAKAHLWLADVATNTCRQITYSAGNDHAGEHHAEWAPDGRSILFLAKRGEHTQLFRLPVQGGGEAVPYDLKVTPAGGKEAEPQAIDVTAYFVAPDGKNIAIIAKDPETAADRKLQADKRDAVWVDHDEHFTRLYLLAATGGELAPLAVPADVESVAWGPQADRLIAITTAPHNLSDLGPAASAWLVTVAGSQPPQRLDRLPATVARAAWLPDGKQFAFLAQAEADAPPGYQDLYLYTCSDASTRDLSPGLSGSLLGELASASSKGNSILAPAGIGTHATLVRFDPETGSSERLKLAAPTLLSLGSNEGRTGWAYVAAGSTQPPALYFTPSLDQPAHALATPSLRPDHWRHAPAQVVHWTSDGLTIEGLLYLPPEAAQHPVPLVVNVHGGPTGAWHEDSHALVDFLVGHGWAVLMPNPRGSTNYGAAFAAANRNDLGGGDFRDIMAGVDSVIGHFPVDPARLALMGYSYGGEMAGFAVGKTNRFKAIVSCAPVIDQQSEYGTEDNSWYDRWFYGKPWEHPEDAWRQSPLAGVAHASTPFLLLQGEADATDPLGQAQEMYRALRQAGVPVDLVQYPREDHGPLAAGLFGRPAAEPWHGFDARERIVAFFERAFKTDK